MNADLWEQVERELASTIEAAHQRGLTYWDVLKILNQITVPAVMQKSEAEYYLKGGA